MKIGDENMKNYDGSGSTNVKARMGIKMLGMASVMRVCGGFQSCLCAPKVGGETTTAYMITTNDLPDFYIKCRDRCCRDLGMKLFWCYDSTLSGPQNNSENNCQSILNEVEMGLASLLLESG